MINVIHDTFEFQVHLSRRSLALNPARHHHPRIEHSTDHRSSFDESFDLFVCKLAVMRDEGARVRMAGPETTMKMVERFPKALIASMSDIQNNSQSLHFGQQLAPLAAKSSTGIGALSVGAGPVMGGTKGAQALRLGTLQVAHGDNGISPFET